MAEFCGKGGGSLAFVRLTSGLWLLSGDTVELWVSFGLLQAWFWYSLGKQLKGHLRAEGRGCMWATTTA